MQTIQQANCFLANYQGAPFTTPLSENRPMVISIALTWVACLGLAAIGAEDGQVEATAAAATDAVANATAAAAAAAATAAATAGEEQIPQPSSPFSNSCHSE